MIVDIYFVNIQVYAVQVQVTSFYNPLSSNHKYGHNFDSGCYQECTWAHLFVWNFTPPQK